MRKKRYWREFKDVYPNGGFWGPFWQNGKEFEYIPVPEIGTICHGDKAVGYLHGGSDDQTYGNMRGKRLGKLLTQTINKTIGNRSTRFRTVSVHNDPDFQNLTYGDVPPKGAKCTDLKSGDLLVFCAALQNPESKSKDHGLFIIGYFTVEACFDIAQAEPQKREKIVTEYGNKNAHFSKSYALSWGGTRNELLRAYKKGEEDAKLILVVAKKKQNGKRVSGLLTEAIRITEKYKNKYFYMTAKNVKLLGLNETAGTHGRLLFERGSKWINWSRNEEKHIIELRKILAEGKGFY